MGSSSRREAMQASSLIFFVALWLTLAAQLPVSHAIKPTKFYEFNITEKKITRLCSTKTIFLVNNQFPGPQIDVEEGDSVQITVNSFIEHNITLHWHGIFQNRTGWFDGPAYITQCPIQRGSSYVYKFDIVQQRGTLWWHAHIDFLRATVYGALIIHPDPKQGYPFLKRGEQKPKELVVMLGEWWKSEILDVVSQALQTGAGTNLSDALTINGLPGPLYGKCSQQDTQVFSLEPKKKYLLRLINSAMNVELFFGIAKHTLTVVEADAQYVKPFTTSSVVISPGQTMTILFTTDQDSNTTYSMAAHVFASAPPFIPFVNSTTAAILTYSPRPKTAFPKFLLPSLPAFNESAFSDAFALKLRSLYQVRQEFPLPKSIDEHLFITVGLNIQRCPPGANPNISCLLPVPGGGRFGASMSNISFLHPSKAFLEQHFAFVHSGIKPVGFTTNFPSSPRTFDFTGNPAIANQNAPEGAKARVIRYGAAVEVVLQGTTLLAPENHPIHLHGFDFYVLATGRGNFNRSRDSPTFNLVDPPFKNTISVPAAGWAVIRFIADNPGTWVFHCHLDLHSMTGLDTVFIVEDGYKKSQQLEPPPKDLPPC